MVKLVPLKPVEANTNSSTSGGSAGGTEHRYYDDDDPLQDSLGALYSHGGGMSATHFSAPFETDHSVSTFTRDSATMLDSRDSMRLSQLSASDRQQSSSSILMSSYQIEKNEKEKTISASRLKFNSLQLHGRDTEIASLRAALDRVNSKNGSRELVMIRGVSGSGKTALAMQLVNPVRRLKGTFCRGKFDLYQRDDPYSALTAACREVCGKILRLKTTKKDQYEELVEDIKEKVGDEISLLETIVPELSEIIVPEGVMGDDSGGSQLTTPSVKKQLALGENEKARAKLHYAFRIFIRVLSEHLSPLVIVLDDLQWSDAASLDLLGHLVTDEQCPRLLIVGMYRSDEVDETHIVTKLLDDLDTKDVGLTVTNTPLAELFVEDVNHILMDLFSTDEEKTTMELAELCHRRTLGNTFFLLTYVRMLRDMKLLTFNLGSYKWMWDISEIMSKTAATTNVVQVTREKIKLLPQYVGTRLSIAACLGHTFHLSTLATVWTYLKEYEIDAEKDRRVTRSVGDMDDDEESGDDPDVWLYLAAEDGFIERQDEIGDTYKWIHDKVQESALSLVPEDELSTLKGRIGEILWKRFDEDSVASMIFVIVNLLNDAPPPEDEWEQMGLAKLNLQAATRSADVCAFDSAAKYSERGIGLLPSDAWSRDYDLTLDLYSTAAESENSLGKADLVEQRFNEVYSQKDHPLSGKLRVITVMCQKLAGEMRYDEAVVLTLDALRDMGITFPKGKLGKVATMFSDMSKVKKQLKLYQPEDILRLPKMRRATNKQIMKLLAALAGNCYRSTNHKILMPLVILESAKLTLTNGISEFSAPSFALLGLMFVGIFNDVPLGSKMGNMAMQILDNFDCKTTESRTLSTVTCLCLCWVEPIAGLTVSLIRGYEVGMSTGETEYAMMCIWQMIVVGFQTGKRLKLLDSDSRIYAKQMKEVNREGAISLTTVYWVAVRTLLGEDESPATLLDIESTTTLDDLIVKHEGDNTLTGTTMALQSMVYAFLGQHELGAELALRKRDSYAKVNPAHLTQMPETFSRALSLFAIARATKARKHKKEARKVFKKVKKWASSGNPNVSHYEKLLKAELSALEGKLDAAEGWYQSAIVLASRSGLRQDAALFNERYGDFLLNDRKDNAEAAFKLEEAVKLYNEWGAYRKVRILSEKYARLWPQPLVIQLPLTT